MSPIFDGSSSNYLTRYKQILSGCSFVTIKLLNFRRLTIKCHDRGHASVQVLDAQVKAKLIRLSKRMSSSKYYARISKWSNRDQKDPVDQEILEDQEDLDDEDYKTAS